MPLVRYEVTGYGIALYGMTAEHCRMMGALLKWLTRVAPVEGTRLVLGEIDLATVRLATAQRYAGHNARAGGGPQTGRPS